MGLFSKENCILCNNTVGSLNRIKLNNGTFVCSNCVAKLGVTIKDGFTLDNLRSSTVDELKKRIDVHQNDVNGNLERIENFRPTYKVGGYIWFDDNNKWFVLPKGTLSSKINNSYVFKYDEILNFEVIEDGITITKGGLGKALVGGAIFGIAGAIAGGTSKKTNEICKKLEIKITTKNQDNPVVYVNLIDTDFKKDGMLYRIASKNIQDILSKFQIILDEIEQEKSMNKNSEQNLNSVADEIKKFKDLLDMGAITEEEYEKKKKELLNL